MRGCLTPPTNARFRAYDGRMPTDLEIAESAKLLPIQEIAARAGFPEDWLEPYGRHKAKVSLEALMAAKSRPKGRLIGVTGMSPTPYGEGKTVTTVGLVDALNRIGKKTIGALRQPSLGPVFGVKGGAAGGGRSQLAPIHDINLHFTGDFHAVAAAANLLAAMADNHLFRNAPLNLDPAAI